VDGLGGGERQEISLIGNECDFSQRHVSLIFFRVFISLTPLRVARCVCTYTYALLCQFPSSPSLDRFECISSFTSYSTHPIFSTPQPWSSSGKSTRRMRCRIRSRHFRRHSRSKNGRHERVKAKALGRAAFAVPWPGDGVTRPRARTCPGGSCSADLSETCCGCDQLLEGDSGEWGWGLHGESRVASLLFVRPVTSYPPPLAAPPSEKRRAR